MRQTSFRLKTTISDMGLHLPPRILSAERLENAVVIGFDDGRSAVYSAVLLHTMFPQAEDITDLEAD